MKWIVWVIAISVESFSTKNAPMKVENALNKSPTDFVTFQVGFVVLYLDGNEFDCFQVYNRTNVICRQSMVLE